MYANSEAKATISSLSGQSAFSRGPGKAIYEIEMRSERLKSEPLFVSPLATGEQKFSSF